MGGPFSRLWEVQQWVDEHDYQPDDWNFHTRTRERIDRGTGPDHETIKQRIDTHEYDYPCGAREFSEDKTTTYGFVTESGNVEVVVDAECDECGFTHSDSTILAPTPK
jgi:hypothetical protein